MSQENPKRLASASPPSSELKRLRFANDLWSKDEHLSQDEKVHQGLRGQDPNPRTYDTNDKFQMAIILNLVADVAKKDTHSEQLHVPTPIECMQELEVNQDLMGLIGNCYTKGSYEDIRCHEFLHKNPTSAITQYSSEMDKVVEVASSHYATEKAWNATYVGSAADCFYATITAHCTNYNPNIYARYAAILQSSGMGKSRMIDELSKTHFVLPINLRPKSDTGFPAADEQVRIFLTTEEPNKEKTFRRSHVFLVALFTTASRYLQNIDEHVKQLLPPKNQTIAQKFRFLMTAGQTFNSQGSKRCKFYKDVVDQANDNLQQGSSTSSAPLETPTSSRFSRNGEEIKKKAITLLKCLDLEAADMKAPLPKVILAFDEAHVLSDAPEADYSKFSELRRALRVLIELPIFSVFLSTSRKIQYITPRAEDDKSARVQKHELVLLPPFTELGFDQMVKKISDGALTIEDVSSIEYMASFGRPLFGSRYKNGDDSIQKNIVEYAGEKLLGGVAFPYTTEAKINVLTPDAKLGKLSCMAVRLALEFNATTLKSQDRERTQVEKYMRVCLVMNRGFGTAVTIAPSEPLLAQAAFLLMQDQKVFDLPRSLLVELEGPSLDKGDRGELICLVLLLMARDVAALEKRSAVIEVLLFMKKLLASTPTPIVFKSKPAQCRTNAEDRSFSEAFAGSKMYFNHFIKVHDFKVINRAFLWQLIARGAAVLCADNQRGIDVLLPFLYLDSKLGRDNVSGIFIQVKNDSRFSSTPNLFLFDAMNPYFLGFFDMDEQNPVPIIRMVFALASSKACIEPIKPIRKNPPRSTKSEGEMRTRLCPAYTAYDIWCAGASAKTFSVIKEGPNEQQVYSDLLKVSRVFPGVYEADTTTESAKSARRNMNPGTAAHPDHWSKFSTAVTEVDSGDEVDVDFDSQEAADDDVEMQL